MSGAHAFKFSDAATALAALATLPGFRADEHQLQVAEQHGAYLVVDWGTLYRETGNTITVDGIDAPESEPMPGHWVYLKTPDASPPEGWEPYTAVDRADAPLVEIGGHYEAQQDGQDQAAITDDTVPTGAPPSITDEQRAALVDLRAQRLAILEPWLARVRSLREQAAGIAALTQAIDSAPERSAAALARIRAIVAERTSLASERDAQAAIVADESRTRDERIAARDKRDRIISDIERLTDEQARLVAFRQDLASSLPTLRADRTVAIAQRNADHSTFQTDRPGVLASLAALRAQRDAIIEGV